MNIIEKFLAYLRLKEAIRIADKAHEENGKRYYVLPNGRTHKLIVTDRNNYRQLRHKGYYQNSAKMIDVKKASFYYTAHKNGEGKSTDELVDLKRMQYYHWVESLNNAKRKGGKDKRNNKEKNNEK